MVMTNIVQFVKPAPPEEVDFDVCAACLCADACAKYPDPATDDSMDAWRAECDREAASKGGFRACDSTIEYGEDANGEYRPMRNGVWL